VAICNQLLARLGARDDLLNIKALALSAQGRSEAAVEAIRKALKLNPKVAGMHLNAAGIYKGQSRFKLAKRHAMEAIRLAPREPALLYQAALLLRDCRDYARALRTIERCLQVQPGFSQGWHLKGSALIDLGHIEAAQQALQKAVELDPDDVRALSSLVKIRGDQLDNRAVVAQLERIRTHAGKAMDRASAGFVLGKMHHRDGQYDAAFSLLQEANGLVAQSRPFDLGGWQRQVEHIRQTGAGDLASPRSSGGGNLVFIIGMPRSGTTLCEQVLSANSNVLACGELAAMEHIEHGFTHRGVDPYRDSMNDKDLDGAADAYLSSLPGDYHAYQLVTDKAPMNFERVGMISRIFPGARFLYCTRHPLDTIFSCFMQDFQALSFATGIEQITQVYIGHVRLMRHWMNLVPGKIRVVNYETYVADQQAATREMAGFLELDYEEGMMAPHLQERAVVTASNLQVRQAVYSSSIGRWNKYEKHLAPAIALLQKEKLLDADLGASFDLGN
jgi:tetratricopeptide (TPR) repeat protein